LIFSSDLWSCEIEITGFVAVLENRVRASRLVSRLLCGEGERWQVDGSFPFSGGGVRNGRAGAFLRVRVFPRAAGSPAEMGLDSSYMAR
jgi:hypothetical protein